MKKERNKGIFRYQKKKERKIETKSKREGKR